MKVKDIAKYVRSKNAGPFWITMDVFCETEEAYNTLKHSPNLTSKKVAALYGVAPERLRIFYVDAIRVIKYSFPRPMPQGHKYECDMHGGQQYVLLAESIV